MPSAVGTAWISYAVGVLRKPDEGGLAGAVDRGMEMKSAFDGPGLGDGDVGRIG